MSEVKKQQKALNWPESGLRVDTDTVDTVPTKVPSPSKLPPLQAAPTLPKLDSVVATVASSTTVDSPARKPSARKKAPRVKDVKAAPASACVCVRVVKLSGESLELHMDPISTVQALKHEIESRWQVPGLCQKLLVGAGKLSDYQLIQELFVNDAKEIDVTLIVSSEEALERLGLGLRGNATERLDALRTIVRLELTLDDQTCSTVAAFLDDKDSWEVTRTAIEVIAKSAPQGSNCAINALLSVASNSTHSLRLLAMKALVHKVPEGHVPALSVACERMADRDDRVRLAALDMFSRLANSGQDLGFSLVGSLVDDPDKKVRLAALDVLARLAAPGDENVISTASMLLQDKDVSIKNAALRVLESVARNDPELIIAARAVISES